MRNIVIVVLLIALGYITWRAGDVERQRYAMLVGMCPDPVTGIDPVCVAKAEPRTSRLWDVYYALVP
jgi:hypothetical protein